MRRLKRKRINRPHTMRRSPVLLRFSECGIGNRSLPSTHTSLPLPRQPNPLGAATSLRALRLSSSLGVLFPCCVESPPFCVSTSSHGASFPAIPLRQRCTDWLEPAVSFYLHFFQQRHAGVAFALCGVVVAGLRQQAAPGRNPAGIRDRVRSLTKLGGFGLLVPLGATAVWQAWKTQRSWPLVSAGLAAIIVAFACSWWLWHNWSLYKDPFATNVLIALMGPRVEPLTWDEFGSLFGFLWKAYWLDFSPGGILFAEPVVYRLIGLVCVLAIIGSSLALVRDRSKRPLFLLIWGWFAVVCVSLFRMKTATAVFMGGGE